MKSVKELHFKASSLTKLQRYQPSKAFNAAVQVRSFSCKINRTQEEISLVALIKRHKPNVQVFLPALAPRRELEYSGGRCA